MLKIIRKNCKQIKKVLINSKKNYMIKYMSSEMYFEGGVNLAGN